MAITRKKHTIFYIIKIIIIIASIVLAFIFFRKYEVPPQQISADLLTYTGLLLAAAITALFTFSYSRFDLANTNSSSKVLQANLVSTLLLIVIALLFVESVWVLTSITDVINDIKMAEYQKLIDSGLMDASELSTKRTDYTLPILVAPLITYISILIYDGTDYYNHVA